MTLKLNFVIKVVDYKILGADIVMKFKLKTVFKILKLFFRIYF